MTLKQAIKEADNIRVSVHMNPGISYQVRISKKDARIIARDYLDRSFEHENIENEEGSIVANYDERTSYKTLYLGR